MNDRKIQNNTPDLDELPSLTTALDIWKSLAEDAHAIHAEVSLPRDKRHDAEFSPTLEKCIRMKKVLTRGKSLLGAVILMTETAILKMTCQNWFEETATVYIRHLRSINLSIFTWTVLLHLSHEDSQIIGRKLETKSDRAFHTCMSEKAPGRRNLDTSDLQSRDITQSTLAKLFSDLLRIRKGVMERRKVALTLRGDAGKDEDYLVELDEYSAKIISETGYVFERFGGHRSVSTIPVGVQAKRENDATRKENNWKTIQDYIRTVQYAYDIFFYLEKKYCN
ncbi:hypothetical protein V9T40_006564 [Parthenolecanium corni]|uniref:Uncharacterized protein n=1 Tax=Parthenolecanium corni TaxID=536013 RepID=A0AAN9TZJ7_9HEMI